MTATWVMEALCVAGVLFLIRFLVALFREGRSKATYRIVHLSSRYPLSKDDAPGPITEVGAGPRIDPQHGFRFQVITGATKPRIRRAG